MMEICRLCLRRGIPLRTIGSTTAKRISNLSNIQFAPEDDLPKLICGQCHNSVNKFTKFRYQIEVSHKWLWNNMIESKLNKSHFDLVLDEQKEDIIEIPTFKDDLFGCDKNKSDFMIDCGQLDLSKYLDINADKNDGESLNFEEFLYEKKHSNSSLTCKECNKTFSRLSSLKIHQKRHSMKPSHICEKCGKGYYDKAGLDRHEQMHLEVKRFPCEFCEKSFSRNSERQRHMLYHLNTKRFKCEICHKSFFESGHLKKHTMMHLNLKPFSCNTCGKDFSAKSKLTRHLKVHSTKSDRNITWTGANEQLPTANNQMERVEYVTVDSNSISNIIEGLNNTVGEENYVIYEEPVGVDSTNINIDRLYSAIDGQIYYIIEDGENESNQLEKQLIL